MKRGFVLFTGRRWGKTTATELEMLRELESAVREWRKPLDLKSGRPDLVMRTRTRRVVELLEALDELRKRA